MKSFYYIYLFIIFIRNPTPPFFFLHKLLFLLDKLHNPMPPSYPRPREIKTPAPIP
jgi:hypothetical protein